MSEATEIEDSISADGKVVENKDDDELDSLLSDALNDFGKSMLMPNEANKKADLLNINIPTDINPEMIAIDPFLLDNLWNEPSMKEAMSHFENSIRSVFNSSTTTNENVTTNTTQNSDEKTAQVGSENNSEPGDSVDVDSLIDDFRKMAKMTAETFSKDCGIESSVNAMNEGGNLFSDEFSKSFIQVAQKLSSTVIKNESSMNNEEEEDNGFHNMVSQTIKSLSDNNKDLESCFNLTDCSEQLGKFLKGIENNENVNKNFLKFMKICMRTIKLVVYPSLKDLCEKYPSFIQKNRSVLSESEMANYKKQYEIMDSICKLFETEKMEYDKIDETDDDVDSEETDRLYKTFLNILNVMKEIQDCGQLPEELVQKRTQLFEDLSNKQNVSNRNCSIS